MMNDLVGHTGYDGTRMGTRRLYNRVLFARGYLRGDPVVRHYPITLEIEATNRCYEDCFMCPRRYMQRPVGDLTLETLHKCLEPFHGQVELVNLFHAGEPLMHDTLPDLVRGCHEHGAAVLITSTGALLSGETSRRLIESGLDMIVFSLDAATDETYRQVRKHSRYDRVVANIRQLLDLKKQLGRGPFVQVQMVAMDVNRHETRRFVSQWRGVADSVRVKHLYNTANIAPRIGEPVPQPPLGRPRPCIMLWCEPVVCWDGTVLPCCVDLIGQAPIGNVHDRSLLEIWNGPELVEMRRKHAAGRYDEVDLCRRCKIFQVKWPFVVARTLFHELTVRKLSPLVERLETVHRLRRFSYF